MQNVFNFYIDDELKDKVQNRLATMLPGHPKGLTASLIRVYLQQFVGMKEVPASLLDAVCADYEYMAKKNKRGKTKM